MGGGRSGWRVGLTWWKNRWEEEVEEVMAWWWEEKVQWWYTWPGGRGDRKGRFTGGKLGLEVVKDMA